MSSRKKLKNSINHLETELKKESTELSQHKHYFKEFLNEHRYLVAASILLPAFLAGWREGKPAPESTDKTQKKRGAFRRFSKFMVGTALSGFRFK